jgi:15-cis-phytoene synthase
MSHGLLDDGRGGLVESSIDTFQQARAMTRTHAKTFYFASHTLPPHKREASYALYSFCRYVDDVADRAAGVGTAKAQLEAIRGILDSLYEADGESPSWAALRETVKRYGIPPGYLRDLVHGVEMDLSEIRCDTFDDLERYCYYVASVVGLMMTRVLQPDRDDALPYAEDLGTAMQLTNILRDIGEDYAMHRVYLPRDEMREWKITEEVLRDGVVTPAFRSFMQFQISRARQFYEKAEPGMALLPDDGSRFCVRLMSTLYGRILHAIEANDYDVFTKRAHVVLPLKLRYAASITLHRQGSPYFLLGRSRREDVRAKALQRTRYASHTVPTL